MKFLVTLLLICAVYGDVKAQDSTANRKSVSTHPFILNKAKSSSTHGINYEHSFSMGGKICTSGWSIFGDYTKDQDIGNKRVLYFELEFLRSPKETKRVNEFTIGYSSPKPFIYGKQNTFFNLKGGVGQKILIGEKAEKSGFEVNFNYAAGLAIGFIKPYYLDVYNIDNENNEYIESVRYNNENASLFLDATSIYGASGFSKGFNEISVVPGLFAKTGLNFDWASNDDFVKAVEAGMGGELYTRNIPIMILANNHPYFFYLYLSLQLGKKW